MIIIKRGLVAKKKTEHQLLAKKMRPVALVVYLRTRIGRYFCTNKTFDHDIRKARAYSSVSSCIGAIKQMTPEFQSQLMRRGVWLEVRKVGEIELPSSAFSKVAAHDPD